MMKAKRGLSPVIATMLLIALALILAAIIYFWAKSFIGEGITKQNVAIETLCDDVSFDAQATASPSEITIQNLGTIPIYGVEIRKQETGEVTLVDTIENQKTIIAGQSATFSISGSGIVADENLLIVPILLGEVKGKTKAHVCDKDYGVSISVI
jgi:flagellin-like protein